MGWGIGSGARSAVFQPDKAAEIAAGIGYELVHRGRGRRVAVWFIAPASQSWDRRSMTTITQEAPARSREAEPLGDDTARTRLLRAAADLFCRYGINATGVDAVVTAAGTAKTTLYKTFGSKEGLVEAVLEAEGAAWRDWFLAEIEKRADDPVGKLIGVFDVLEAWFAQDHFFGCPFINVVGEFDKEDERYKRIALAHKSIIMKRLTELAAESGAEAPEALAHQIGLLIDGSIVAAMISGDASIARFARSATAKLLA